MPVRHHSPAWPSANLFVTSYQNDQIYEAIGEATNKLGYKRVYALVPNLPGRNAIAGFKRTFKGELVRRVAGAAEHDRLGPEVSKISASKADALFTFMPGAGLGSMSTRSFRPTEVAGDLGIHG